MDNRPSALDGKRPCNGGGEVTKQFSFQNHGVQVQVCNRNAEVCLMCMTHMTGIERQVTGALLRLSRLEDTKSGAIEITLVVK